MRDTTLVERMHNRNKLIYQAMKHGEWFTLSEINVRTGYPTASASAGMRDFRKAKYGSNTLEKEYLGAGVYKYRLIVNPENNILENLYR